MKTEQHMNPILRLQAEYILAITMAIAIAVVYETGLVDEGQLAGIQPLTYWLDILGVVLVLVLVPMALKLMSFNNVKRRIHDSIDSYVRWSEVRLAMLTVPLLVNISQYYVLGTDVTCGYLALIVLVAFLFIWPSHSRAQYERDAE